MVHMFGPLVIQFSSEQSPNEWFPWRWAYIQFDESGQCRSVLYADSSETTENFSSPPLPQDCQSLTIEPSLKKLRIFDPSGQFHGHKIYYSGLSQYLYLFPVVSTKLVPHFLRPTLQYLPKYNTTVPVRVDQKAFEISPQDASLLFTEITEPLSNAWIEQYKHWKERELQVEESKYTEQQKQWQDEKETFLIDLTKITIDSSPIPPENDLNSNQRAMVVSNGFITDWRKLKSDSISKEAYCDALKAILEDNIDNTLDPSVTQNAIILRGYFLSTNIKLLGRRDGQGKNILYQGDPRSPQEQPKMGDFYNFMASALYAELVDCKPKISLNIKPLSSVEAGLWVDPSIDRVIRDLSDEATSLYKTIVLFLKQNQQNFAVDPFFLTKASSINFRRQDGSFFCLYDLIHGILNSGEPYYIQIKRELEVIFFAADHQENLDEALSNLLHQLQPAPSNSISLNPEAANAYLHLCARSTGSSINNELTQNLQQILRQDAGRLTKETQQQILALVQDLKGIYSAIEQFDLFTQGTFDRRLLLGSPGHDLNYFERLIRILFIKIPTLICIETWDYLVPIIAKLIFANDSMAIPHIIPDAVFACADRIYEEYNRLLLGYSVNSSNINYIRSNSTLMATLRDLLSVDISQRKEKIAALVVSENSEALNSLRNFSAFKAICSLINKEDEVTLFNGLFTSISDDALMEMFGMQWRDHWVPVHDDNFTLFIYYLSDNDPIITRLIERRPILQTENQAIVFLCHLNLSKRIYCLSFLLSKKEYRIKDKILFLTSALRSTEPGELAALLKSLPLDILKTIMQTSPLVIHRVFNEINERNATCRNILFEYLAQHQLLHIGFNKTSSFYSIFTNQNRMATWTTEEIVQFLHQLPSATIPNLLQTKTDVDNFIASLPYPSSSRSNSANIQLMNALSANIIEALYKPLLKKPTRFSDQEQELLTTSPDFKWDRLFQEFRDFKPYTIDPTRPIFDQIRQQLLSQYCPKDSLQICHKLWIVTEFFVKQRLWAFGEKGGIIIKKINQLKQQYNTEKTLIAIFDAIVHLPRDMGVKDFEKALKSGALYDVLTQTNSFSSSITTTLENLSIQQAKELLNSLDHQSDVDGEIIVIKNKILEKINELTSRNDATFSSSQNSHRNQLNLIAHEINQLDKHHLSSSLREACEDPDSTLLRLLKLEPLPPNSQELRPT